MTKKETIEFINLFVSEVVMLFWWDKWVSKARSWLRVDKERYSIMKNLESWQFEWFRELTFFSICSALAKRSHLKSSCQLFKLCNIVLLYSESVSSWLPMHILQDLQALCFRSPRHISTVNVYVFFVFDFRKSCLHWSKRQIMLFKKTQGVVLALMFFSSFAPSKHCGLLMS